MASQEPETFVGDVLLSQYNDLLRGPLGTVKARHRLLCVVLEYAIRSYLINTKCSTGN